MYADLIPHLAAGATVVTSTRRLAHSVRRAYASHMLRQGPRTWPAADVLTWEAWLERVFEAAAIRGRSDGTLISPWQTQMLWERVIQESPEGQGLLPSERVAASALEAAELMHAWRLRTPLESAAATEESRAFLRWKDAYERICAEERLVDPARLDDIVREILLNAPLTLPSQLILVGFDTPTRQQQDVLTALERHGGKVAMFSSRGKAAAAVVWRHASTTEEIRGAAVWARGWLDKSAASVGIVVPDLTRLRATVARVFDEVMVPQTMLDPWRAGGRPWNMSLGVALLDWPLARSALSILDLACGPVATELAGALLRSPFIGGAESERMARALLDARLRRSGAPRVGLDELLYYAGAEGHAHSCRLLAERLTLMRHRLRELPRLPQPMSFWVPALSAVLAAAGWPGERELDSDEYQTLVKWNETMAGLARLDFVLRPTTLAGAVSVLRAQARQLLFQPESPDVPIQVLGLLESAQLEFDHLLVLGLTDEAWPRVARPNPLLPISLQRAQGVPHSSAEWELGFARRLQAGWLRAAASVVFSYHESEDDRTLGPSPLLKDLPIATAEALQVAPHPSWRSAVLAAAAAESVADWHGRALPPGVFFRNGARVLQDQSACGFRAFAAHRLGARALAHPHEGLDAATRGTLVHAALAALWSTLGTYRRFIDTPRGDLVALIERCVLDALRQVRRRRGLVSQTRFLDLERERLVALLSEWLEVERVREAFEVEATERDAEVSVGGLALRVRMDRIDRLASGAEVVLDYKTGRMPAQPWVGDRPDEPQLLLYTLARPGLAALAFAQVRRGECKLSGVSGSELVLGASTAETMAMKRTKQWQEQLAAWQAVVEQLAVAFRSGAAPVDPRRGTQTCRTCDLSNLCRVSEFKEHDWIDANRNDAP